LSLALPSLLRSPAAAGREKKGEIMRYRIRPAVALLAALPGCATITGSELQSILVSTRTRTGEPLEKAECTLQSPSGLWKVTTPGSVMVLRSAEDMQVECRREGHPPGLAKLVSRAHGGMFGNIIFGGGIGALIDHSKGTGYEYPNVVMVTMGEVTLIDRRDEADGSRNAPAQDRPERR